MKEFFKRYSYDSVKMALNQIALTIFGFSLALTSLYMGNKTLLWVSSLCAVIFYLVLTYGVAWNAGYRRYNAVQRGEEAPNWFTGLWISLLANSLNLLLAILNLIDNGFSAVPKGGIFRTVALMIQGMYQGLLSSLAVNGAVVESWGWTYFAQFDGLPLYNAWWSYFVIVLPALVVSTVAYIFGVKGWHLTNAMMPQVPMSDRPTKQELKERKKQTKDKNA